MNQTAKTDKSSEKAGVWALAKAVFWSFLGIRRRQDYEADTASISLKQVIVAGIIGGIVFVVGVIALVKVILANVGTST
ncbi:MAG: DUF2970 domain-containing protein [Rugosibacter sp.]